LDGKYLSPLQKQADVKTMLPSDFRKGGSLDWASTLDRQVASALSKKYILIFRLKKSKTKSRGIFPRIKMAKLKGKGLS
jgi:hypothetical protein